MLPQESWKEPPSGESLRSIFSFLCHDPSSRFAKLSLGSGSSWSQSSERMVHRAVLGALAPILIKEQQVDMVIVPDATEDSLVTITELIYTGRVNSGSAVSALSVFYRRVSQSHTEGFPLQFVRFLLGSHPECHRI